ncbi:MAG TPA: acetate/propionate family kinase [Candidatus Limnocylindrales bacterium]|jgi:acetate kinase|nr:acetate/propionate family kinase [Candidatus Limnocylindrales bacterium]
MRVLVLNPGSSSLKSSVVEAEAVRAAASAPLAQVDVDWGVDATTGTDPADDIRALLKRYEAAGVPTASLGAVGYRVVHGGERFREPTLVTPEVVAEVDALRALAPLHNGIAVAAMRAGLAAIPQLPHVAVFDTAFHATLPEDAYRYPVPEEWYSGWGVRRYGFHGISVAWSAERAATLLDRPAGELRLAVAHLGSGCSVTAVDGGRSVATSMGLTPLEGLMMGTRAGSIDPGALFYLLRTGRLDADELAEQMDHESGLVGVSGRTSDVRELLALEAAGDKAATLALAIFVRRAAECIAASATSLPVLDAIVFTGGIGENAAAVRARIVARLGSIGVAPIVPNTVSEDGVISAPGATPAVLRIEAREDLVVAREAARLAEAGRTG